MTQTKFVVRPQYAYIAHSTNMSQRVRTYERKFYPVIESICLSMKDQFLVFGMLSCLQSVPNHYLLISGFCFVYVMFR